MLRSLATGLLVLFVLGAAHAADEGDWIELGGPNGLDAWEGPPAGWHVVGTVEQDPKDPKRLTSGPGSGILDNGAAGRTPNLISKRGFGDIEVRLEFLVPKGSNSGVKLEGLYEVQIADSWGVAQPKASDCGGVYPRAELLPRYHHIDDGYPPKLNACLRPGEWQTLEIAFRAPRFDESGKKVANARFEKVVLNSKLIHEDLEVPTPTGHAWRDQEKPTGPLLLQADHGPVAFRSVRVRPLGKAKGKGKE
jgi:hypothetical protein